jgi:hypothetical protein
MALACLPMPEGAVRTYQIWARKDLGKAPRRVVSRLNFNTRMAALQYFEFLLAAGRVEVQEDEYIEIWPSWMLDHDEEVMAVVI